MSTKGRINIIKERLLTLISTADASLQPKTTHLSGEWDFHPRLVGRSGILQNLPYVTVRINTDILGDEIYGRDIGGGPSGSEQRGNITTVTWSAHVLHSACMISGIDRHRNAQDLADKIMDYLVQQAGSQETWGISDIYEMNARESTPRDMPKKVSRIVIEGRMDCVRPD